MEIIKSSDDNYKKCIALKIAGITVNHYKRGNRIIYVVTIDKFPDADNYIETTFNSINDIIFAFRDKLVDYKFQVVAA